MQRRSGLAGVIGVVALVALTAVGCGDDDGGESSDDATSETTAADATEDATADDASGDGAEDDPAADDPAEDDAAEDDAGTDAADVPAAGAVATVDGEEFVFDQDIVCLSLGGAVGGSFTSSSADISFDVDLPPEDWETRPADEGWSAPSVRLDDDRADVPLSWRAGGEVVEGMNGIPPEVEVTSYTVDGAAGSGTATVVEITRIGIDDPVVAEMTFEFSCG